MLEFSVKLSDIAQVVGGEVTGNGETVINSFATSPETSTEKDIVFIYSKRYFKNIPSFKAKAMILPLDLKEKYSDLKVPVVWVQRPRLVLKKLLTLLQTPRFKPGSGIHQTAIVDPTVKLGRNCAIGAGVFIAENSELGDNIIIYPNTFIGKNVKIGNNTLIYPNVSIMDFSQIGKNVVLHSGVVIGADGFSFVTEEEGNLEKVRRGETNLNTGRQIQHKIPSVGNVIIEDDVEIGANSTIDAATISSTIIKAGTKIDNLVMIAHNVKVGNDCIIVSQCGIAGSVNIGDRVIMGGQAGFADNMNIGDDAVFVARSAAHGEIPPRSVYSGMPAVPYMEFIRNEKNKKRLPRKYEALEKQVKELEEKIKLLEERLKVTV